MNEFSNLSINITKNINKIDKKNEGIYFTPKSIIKKNIEILKPYFKNIKNILEPSCGSGEYINYINDLYNNINITGIEKNEYIYENIKYLSNNNIKILNENYLDYKSNTKYDLIIGNPPYFVVKKSNISNEYYKYIEGRPNIFTLFIIKSFELLNENGLISFILPKNFTNCLYYNKVRKYINNNFKIIDLIDCSNDKYIETEQDTIIFIIQKCKYDNKNNVINISDYYTFNTKENIIKLKELYKNSTNLYKLDFEVYVGKLVWNQNKNILTDDETKTRLIYSSDIVNNEIVKKKYKDENKKNYINKKGEKDIILVINRGYGKGEYVFNYCIINVDYEYLIENHLICIKYKKDVCKEELIKLYEKIINSLNLDKTKEFINLYFGNNAINTTELSYILPIYDI